MLEIFINDQKVDLPDDIEINLVYENPLFSTDRIPAPYSLDFEIPATPRNMAIAGHPERIAHQRDHTPVAAQILFAGRRLIDGTATPEPMAQAIGYSICGATLPVDIKKRLSRQLLERWDLTQQSTTYPLETDSEQYNNLLMMNIGDADFPIVAAPMVTKETTDTQAQTPSEQYATLREAYISPFNTADRCYLFRSDDSGGIAAGNILPAIRVGYLFGALLGQRLKRNIFATGEWRKLVLISTFHPDFALEGTGAPLRRSAEGAALWIEDIVPEITAAEMITELLKVPCATLYLKGDSYNIEYNKDILRREVVHNWTGKLIDTPTIATQAPMNYKFAYSNDMPCEIAPYLFSTPTIKDMLTTGYSGYVRVFFPRQTFCCTPTDDTVTTFGYKVINHGDSKADTQGDADDDATQVYDMSTAAEMLINGLYPYLTTAPGGTTLPQRYLYVPQIEPISEKRSDTMALSLYHGMCPDVSRQAQSRTYPYLCSSNYDTAGNRIGELSIEPAALYREYHKPFAEWLARRHVTITVDLLLDMQDVADLDLRDKFHIRGRDFLIKELRVAISQQRIESCQAEMVEV